MPLSHEEFISLYTAAQPAIQRYVSYHIPDYHAVQDVMQKTAVALWKKAGEYETGSDFQRWAVTVARYEVLLARRAVARGRLVLTDDLCERVEARAGGMTFDRIEGERRALSTCLARLSVRQRDVLKERYAEGKTCARIARERGANQGQVRTQLCRIRAALRRCIARALGDGGRAQEAGA